MAQTIAMASVLKAHGLDHGPAHGLAQDLAKGRPLDWYTLFGAVGCAESGMHGLFECHVPLFIIGIIRFLIVTR